MYEARLELMYRGVSREEIEDRAASDTSWSSIPLEHTEVLLGYFDSKNEVLIDAMFFAANHYGHMVLGFDRATATWDAIFSKKAFKDRISSIQREGLVTFALRYDKEQLEDFDFDNVTDIGSFVLKRFIEDPSMPIGFLWHNGDEYERPILWPSWFDSFEACPSP